MTIKEFNALPRNEKVILVCKDVLKRIDDGQYIPNTGNYIDLLDRNVYLMDDDDVRKKINDIKNCKVCALGACILSTTSFANKLKYKNIKDISFSKESANVYKLLKKLFTLEQLLLIECAFEGWDEVEDYSDDIRDLNEDFYYTNFEFNYRNSVRIATEINPNIKLTFEQAKKCNDIFNSISNNKKRLIFIMNNIINNNGIFTI
jgi:hypothetical protein